MIIIDFLLIISVVLFIAMFLQGRYIDYWIPFAVLFIAFHAEFLSKNYSLLVGSRAFSWMLSAKYKLKSGVCVLNIEGNLHLFSFKRFLLKGGGHV